MGVLDQVMQLKSQGKPDEQIIQEMRDQGISPREINDALNQADIKKAVSQEDQEAVPTQDTVPSPEMSAPPAIQEYTPSQEDLYSPQPAPQMQPAFNQPMAFPQQDQLGYGADSMAGMGMDTDMIIEIAEQVASEKTADLQRQVQEIKRFQAVEKAKVENFEIRLKKIEAMIDKLQSAILTKIGSYGDNLSSIKKEMTMMQDSFGKLINPLVTHTKRKHTKKKTSKKKK